jgi:hypothetical protein
MRKIIISAAAAVLAALAVIGLAGTAGATEQNGIITRATTSYTSPSNNSAPVLSLAPGTAVETVCYTEGQHLDGSNYWFRVLHDDTSSFVPRASITPPSELRHC